jgi:hypothetical protein
MFQIEINVVLFKLVGMHRPSPKIKEDIEFLKLLNVKHFPGKNLGNGCGNNLITISYISPRDFMFWDQSQNRPCKIIKNLGQRHQDQ